METAQAATEDQFYANLSATREDKPWGYPTDTYTDPNDKVAKVRGDGNKIGPSMLLKVMAGDKFHIHASAWWTGTASGSNTSPLTSIVSALIGSAPGISGGKIGSADLTGTILDPQITAFLSNQPAVSGKPKAYLNWILFDEQFKYVGDGSGAEAVDESGVLKQFNKPDMPVNKNGYLYIYVSNETAYDVFFDNLQVTHVRGRLLEESHYYPFGLTMAGISSRALNVGGNGPDCGCPNKKGFNGNEIQQKEFSDGSGLDVYDFNARTYDQQIGRFIQIDPKASEAGQESLSPYHFGLNNPVRYQDSTGNCPVCLIPIIISWFTVETVAVTAVAGTTAILTSAAIKDYKNNHSNNSSGSNQGSSQDQTYNGKHDTESQTPREALRKAKEENGIPRSQQPDRTIEPNTPEGNEAGLDDRNVKQYDYTTPDGKKVTIRQDKAANYNEGGVGDYEPPKKTAPVTNQKPPWQVW